MRTCFNALRKKIGGGLDNLYILLYVHTLLFGIFWEDEKILKPIVFQIGLNPPPSYCTEFTGWKEWNPSIQRDLSGMIE